MINISQLCDIYFCHVVNELIIRLTNITVKSDYMEDYLSVYKENILTVILKKNMNLQLMFLFRQVQDLWTLKLYNEAKPFDTKMFR